MPNFMHGGAGNYEKALRQEYDEARRALRARRKGAADLLGRQAIENELQDLEKEFKSRLKQIHHGLFGTR